MPAKVHDIQSIRKKRKRNNRVYYIVLGMIIFYLGIKFMPAMGSFSKETSIAKYGNIQIVEKLNCYIIRNETVVRSHIEGKINYFVQEGEKVEKGYTVAEVERGTIDDVTRKKLEVVNQRIENVKKNENNLFQSDIKKLDEEIMKIIEEIKKCKEKENLIKIEELQIILNNKLEKKRMIAGDKSFTGKNLENLKLEQEKLEERVNNGICFIKSPVSGVVSYNIDGYEDMLTPKKMLGIDIDKLKDLDSKIMDLRVEKIISNKGVFKIVDNNIWYMIAPIENDRIKKYKVGQGVTFKFPQRDVRGSIYKIIKNEGRGQPHMVIFRVDQYVENFYSLRNIEVDTIVVNYEGLKIHQDSIIEKDGRKGVYVLDVNRRAIFKPIKVIGHDDEYAIVCSNVFDEKTKDGVKAVRTVKLYDEVARNASKVKEKDII